MKKYAVAFCLCFQALCAEQEPIRFMDDSVKNMEERLQTANSSLYAVHTLLPRIQTLIHKDPEKATDLVFKAFKFLTNAEACLYNNPLKREDEK